MNHRPHTPPRPVRRTSPTTEEVLEAYFFKRLQILGAMPIKLAPTRKGTPDRMVLLPGGRLELVELKRVGGKLSPAQIHWHERAAQLGVHVTVLTGTDEINAWIRDQFNGKQRPTKKEREALDTEDD